MILFYSTTPVGCYCLNKIQAMNQPVDFDGVSTIDNVLHSEAQLLFADNNNDYSSSYQQQQQHINNELPQQVTTVCDTVVLETDIRASIKLREEYLNRLIRLVDGVSSTQLQMNLLDILSVMENISGLV